MKCLDLEFLFGRILFLLWFQSHRGLLKPVGQDSLGCRGSRRPVAAVAALAAADEQPRPVGRPLLSTWWPLMLMEAAKRYWGCGIFGVITLFFNIGNTAIGVYLTVVERGSSVLVFESIVGLNSSEHKLCENLKFPVFSQCWPMESIKSYKESNSWSSAVFSIYFVPLLIRQDWKLCGK